MVSPRERQRPTRRRIAGERTRPSGGGSPATPPTERAEPTHEPAQDLAQEPVQAPVQEPVEDQPATSREGSLATREAEVTGDTRTVDLTKDAQTVPTADEQHADAAQQTVEEAPEQPAAAATARPAQRFPLASWLRDDDTPGPPNWVLGVLVGLLVAALALDGFVVWREVSHRQAAEDAARATHNAVVQSPSVASKAAEALLSYRYDQLPQDLAQARQYLTADYAPDYVNTIRKLVANSAEHLKVTVQAKVLAAGISEAGPRRADVLLFVNQTTTSAAEAPKTALNRVVFTMVPRNGTWKVNEIQAF